MKKHITVALFIVSNFVVFNIDLNAGKTKETAPQETQGKQSQLPPAPATPSYNADSESTTPPLTQPENTAPKVLAATKKSILVTATSTAYNKCKQLMPRITKQRLLITASIVIPTVAAHMNGYIPYDQISNYTAPAIEYISPTCAQIANTTSTYATQAIEYGRLYISPAVNFVGSYAEQAKLFVQSNVCPS